MKVERDGIEHGFTWWGIIVFLITIAGIWIKQSVRWVFGVNDRLKDHARRLDSVEPQVKGHDSHLARLDISFARQDEKLDGLNDKLDLILEELKK